MGASSSKASSSPEPTDFGSNTPSSHDFDYDEFFVDTTTMRRDQDQQPLLRTPIPIPTVLSIARWSSHPLPRRGAD